jgi:hypothetical protein
MTVLTSTGNVNLTSSTNWSPAQIPTSADDLVLANGHTLTVDADATILSLTVNSSTTSRMTPSGAVRELTVTNGITYLGNVGQSTAYWCVVSGTEFTLNARHDFGTNSGSMYVFYANPLSVLNLNATSLADELLSVNAVGYNRLFFFLVADEAEVNVVGRVSASVPTGNGSTAFNCKNGSNVTISHTGISTINIAGQHQKPFNMEGFGATSLTLNGDWDLPNIFGYSGVSGFFYLNSTATLNVNGNINHLSTVSANFAAGVFRLANASAVVNMNGSITQYVGCGTAAIYMTAGTFNWVSQTAVIPVNRQLYIGQYGGTFVCTDLIIENSGSCTIIAYNAVGANAGLTNKTASAGGSVFPSTTFTITNAEVQAPVLPNEEDVTSGTVYGYTGIDKTGTGLIVDPAILAAALSVSLASYVSPPTGSPVERSPNDTNPITFSWPVSGATITTEVSIDNAAYGATTGVVSFLRTEGSLHYYSLSYHADDRPTAEGTARYKLVDGTYTQYVTLRVDGISAELLANARIAAQNTQS